MKTQNAISTLVVISLAASMASLSRGMKAMLLTRGVPFHGHSTGTRKAMRAAKKRRRFNARQQK